MSTTVSATVKPVIPLFDYQRKDVECAARFNWSCWSRQVGKSFSKSLRRLLRGIERRRTQVLLSGGERQSRELMDKVRSHCQMLKIHSELTDNKYFEGTQFKQLEITVPNGVRIIGLPANPDTARGFTGDVFLDEFAVHKKDREIWASVFPTILRGDGELDVASTPKGKNNSFYRLRSNGRFHHSTVTIVDAIRDGLQADIDELREGMGDEELFRQEFMCEFIDEATAFLTYELIAGVEDLNLPLPLVGTSNDVGAVQAVIDTLDQYDEVYAGIDIGRRGDLTVIWLFARVGDMLVTIAVIELKRMRFRAQYGIFAAILSHSNVRRVSIDETGIGMQIAEAAVEDYGAHRVDNVYFTVTVKQKLAEQLRIRAEDCSMTIPSCDTVRNDWHSIEKMTTTGGNVLYRADRNPTGHADRFWAAALAVDAAQTGTTGPIEYVGSEDKLAYARQGVW